jgi:CheY-like chemotaxis protein
MLREFVGHEVRTAHDGLNAVTVAAGFQPHAVLLDIGLPVLNGYEAAKRIRRAPGRQPVLVALTGWGQADDRRRAVEAGFDHHLIKSVDHDVLMTLVASVPIHTSA